VILVNVLFISYNYYFIDNLKCIKMVGSRTIIDCKRELSGENACSHLYINYEVISEMKRRMTN